jgi:hypothetical protein
MTPTDSKYVMLTPPGAIVDNAAFTTVALDTRGWGFVEIFVLVGALDIAMAALKVQESDAITDANTLTSGTDITGAVFGTSTNDTGAASTLPSATADNSIFKFEIDLKGRKRYLDVAITGGDGAAGTYATVFAKLSKGEQVPTTAAQKGCSQILRVPSL